MKIRLTGTRAECEDIAKEFKAKEEQGKIRELTISGFYLNRENKDIGRVYLEFEKVE